MPSLFYAGQPDYIEKLNTLATAASMTNGTVAASFLSLAVTGTATAASFVGPLAGNASTATTLATARNINGVAFNGSADITVAAAAGTLTGTTLAANVVNASISSIVPYGGAALYIGDGTQAQVVIARGPGSGVNNGAAFIVQNGGAPLIALGNKSALVGGAYDATPLLYGNAPIEVNQALNVTGSISATGNVTANGSSMVLISGGNVGEINATATEVKINTSSAGLPVIIQTGSVTRAYFSSTGLSVAGSISATTYLTVGSGTGNPSAAINGAASGTSGGASLVVQNAGNPIVGIGNKSALLGGAYDATPMLYGNAPIEVNQALNVTGSISATSYVEGAEQAAPAAPAANGYRIFAQDNGAGKTQLMVIFASGAAQQIAIEP